MTVTEFAPEQGPEVPGTTWDRVQWEHLPADGNRYEVIDGVLYTTPAPDAFHQLVVRRVARLLDEQLETHGVGRVYCAPVTLFMPGCDPVQPAMLVVRAEDQQTINDTQVHGIPALLVELLCASANPALIAETKLGAYARAGVPEYWIVRPAERDLLIYSQPDPMMGIYTRLTVAAPEAILHSPTLPLHTAVAALFAPEEA